MCEKRNQDTAIALGLIILQSQRVQFPSREIKTVSDAFCGALSTVLDHYKEIKHFTEERGYILHCTFNHSCDALLLFCFGPTAHTVLPLQMELSQDVPRPEERSCCSEESQLPQGPGTQN